jgi:uncharacterized Zn finger protein
MEKNLKDYFICPKCAKDKGLEQANTEINIKGMNIMFNDTLSMIFECKDCGTIWKSYIKAMDASAEVLYVSSQDTQGEDATNEDIVEE